MEGDWDRHQRRCRQYHESVVGTDPYLLAERFNWCISGRHQGGNEPLRACHYCKRALFCHSDKCMIEQLPKHMQTCLAYLERVAQPMYTSRSAVDQLWLQLERSPAVMDRLARQCSDGEAKTRAAGVVLLAENSVEELCVALNTAGRDEGDVFKFMSVQELLRIDRTAFTPVMLAKAAAVQAGDTSLVVVVVVMAQSGDRMQVWHRTLPRPLN